MNKNNSSKRRSLLGLLWFVIIAMGVSVVFFLLHKPLMDWSIEFWAFVISVFAALFSGLNVLVFYQLTLAVESQSDKRQQEALRYDALKYQLERQQEVYKKVEHLKELVVTGALYEPFNDEADALSIDKNSRMITDEFANIQTLENCSQLFPHVTKESVDALLDVSRAWENKQLDFTSYTLLGDDEDVFKKGARKLYDFWSSNATKCIVHLNLIIAQMRYDMQVSLSESLGQEAPAIPDFDKERSSVNAITEVPKQLESMLQGELQPLSPIEWDLDLLLTEDIETKSTEKDELK